MICSMISRGPTGFHILITFLSLQLMWVLLLTEVSTLTRNLVRRAQSSKGQCPRRGFYTFIMFSSTTQVRSHNLLKVQQMWYLTINPFFYFTFNLFYKFPTQITSPHTFEFRNEKKKKEANGHQSNLGTASSSLGTIPNSRRAEFSSSQRFFTFSQQGKGGGGGGATAVEPKSSQSHRSPRPISTQPKELQPRWRDPLPVRRESGLVESTGTVAGCGGGGVGWREGVLQSHEQHVQGGSPMWGLYSGSLPEDEGSGVCSSDVSEGTDYFDHLFL